MNEDVTPASPDTPEVPAAKPATQARNPPESDCTFS